MMIVEAPIFHLLLQASLNPVVVNRFSQLGIVIVADHSNPDGLIKRSGLVPVLSVKVSVFSQNISN
jgi:hypothetical protein